MDGDLSTHVLDTSALLFWTTEPSRLSRSAAQAIQTASALVISSITVWEIGLKVVRGHLTLATTLRDYTQRLQAVGVEIRSVDEECWLRNLELKWSHRDPADRTIVALADLLDAPLVTSDATIAAFYPRTIW